MALAYRGVKYVIVRPAISYLLAEIHPSIQTLPNTAVVQVTATYRGVAYQLQRHRVPPENKQELKLKYRGVNYFASIN